MELDGRRVLIFAENDYEDLELWYPKLRLVEAGAAVTVAGPRDRVYRSKHGYPVEVDGNVADYRPEEFHALVVPGGWCPDRLRRYDEVLAFTRTMVERNRVVSAICHGGWVLASAEVVAGRTVTSVPAIKHDLIHAGARWVDEPVVGDGNLVTAQVPKDLPGFCRALIAAMRERG